MNKHHKVSDEDNDDTLEARDADLLVSLMKPVKSGSISVSTENEEPAMRIGANINRIDINILHPEFLKLLIPGEGNETDNIHNKKGRIEKFRDKLHTAKEFAKLAEDKTGFQKEFAQKLTDNDMTIVLSRKGKEAIILGKEAKPSVSKFVSRSDDVQIKSIREVAKLGEDLEIEED